VDIEGSKDGSACLIVSGPSAEIYSCYNRIRAMARAVHGKNKTTFNLPAGVELNDDRTIDQLRYDLLIRPVPALSAQAVSADPVTGIQTTHEAPLLGADGQMTPGVDSDTGLREFAEEVARTASTGPESTGPAPASSDPAEASSVCSDTAASSSAYSDTTGQTRTDAGKSADCTPGSAFRSDSGDELGPVEYWVKLRMPTSQWWLSQQAATVATVP